MTTDLIVDGNSVYARAFYAVQASTGNPRDALCAALNTVIALLNDHNGNLGSRPDRLLFAWDGAGGRDKHRQPKPNDYYAVAELVVGHLDLLFHAAQHVSDSYEADDIVATAVENSAQDTTVYVVSGDKDLQQLAGHHTFYYSLNKKAVLNNRAILDHWHVKSPRQIAIAQAILGDKVDLVGGIKGWGPAKVKKLFEAVTPEMTFEEAFDVILAQIPAQTRDGFLADLDLTLLHTDVPDVPEPAPIVPADLAVAEKLRLPGLMDFYRPFYRRYSKRTATVIDGDEEDIPKD